MPMPCSPVVLTCAIYDCRASFRFIWRLNDIGVLALCCGVQRAQDNFDEFRARASWLRSHEQTTQSYFLSVDKYFYDSHLSWARWRERFVRSDIKTNNGRDSGVLIVTRSAWSVSMRDALRPTTKSTKTQKKSRRKTQPTTITINFFAFDTHGIVEAGTQAAWHSSDEIVSKSPIVGAQYPRMCVWCAEHCVRCVQHKQIN